MSSTLINDLYINGNPQVILIQLPILFVFVNMAAEAHARSIYRAILRELPARSPTSAASPIRTSIREHFKSTGNSTPQDNLARRQEAEQFAQYLKAQRTYGVLLDRYNPGMNMDEAERVRLSARRVGMEMPKWKMDGN